MMLFWRVITLVPAYQQQPFLLPALLATAGKRRGVTIRNSNSVMYIRGYRYYQYSTVCTVGITGIH